MVYMLMVDGFEDIEALETLDIMRRAGIDVKTAGVYSEYVTSSHNVTVKTDILIDDVKKADMTMLILPGGPGHTELDASKKADELIFYAHENHLYLAAICASPSLLGKRGILSGKNYTCFPGFEPFCEGGNFLGDKAVSDGKVITARGAGAAAEFGFMIVDVLKGKEVSDKLKKEMQYI